MMTATPVAYEIHSDRDLVATVTMFDEGASEVVIKGVNNAQSWQELADAIYMALCNMHPEVKP